MAAGGPLSGAGPKVAADFALLAAAVKLARLAVLGLVRSGTTWATGTS
jgi:hypothetical protein